MNYHFDELKFLGEKLGLDRPEVLSCLEKALRNPQNIPIYKKHFLRLLKQEGMCLADLPDFPRLIEKDIHPDGIHIGYVGEGNNIQDFFLLPGASDDQNKLISGISGSGKSVLVDMVGAGLIKKGKKVLFIDSCDEHSGLLKLFPPDMLLAVTPDKMKINPLEPPPGVDSMTWKGEILNLWRSDLFIRDGGSNELSSLLSSLSVNKINPTMIDLHKAILSRNYRAGSRQAGYIESLKNRSEMFLNSSLREAFMCRQGYPLQDILLKKSFILRLAKISDDLMCTFYLDFLLKWIQTYLEYNPREITHDNVIIIEEAHRYLYKGLKNRSDIREPVMLSLAREVRKLGISLIITDQIPSLLPRQLIGNAKSFTTFRLVNALCVKTISDACGFNQEQREAIPLLGKREAIIFSDSFSQPYKFRTRDFHLPEVSEEYINQRMEEALSALTFTPIPETEDEIYEMPAGAGMEIKSVSRKKITLRPRKIWKDILEILTEVGFIGLTELYESLRASPRFCRKVIQEMESFNMIETCTISLGKRGNPTTYVIIKPIGAEFLGIDYEDIKLAGKGSTEHVLLQNLIASGMKESGRTAVVEHFMNGKSADIVEFENDDKTIAYELELEPNEHIAENINKDIEAGFDEVVIISKNTRLQNEIKDKVYRSVDWNVLQKVRFKLLRDFL